MGRFSKLTDAELDRLLDTEAPSGNGDVAEIAAFVRDVRALSDVGPAEETATRHLAAMAAAAAENGGDAPVLPPAARAAPARERPPRRTWRIPLIHAPLAPLGARLAIAGAAASLALCSLGGAAYAGALPDPVQSAVASLADEVGVSLPGSESTTAPSAPAPAAPAPPVGDTPPAPEPVATPAPAQAPANPPVAAPAQAPADQPDANQVDQPNAGQVDQPNAGQVDQPDANQVDGGQ